LNYLNPVPLQRVSERWLRPLAQVVGANMLALERHLTPHPPLEADMSENSYRVVRIEAELNIERPPEAVFAALTTGLDAWWPHRTRPTARIVYEPRVGGRVFEDWGDGGGMAYGQVIEYAPDQRHMPVFSGGFGSRMYTSKNIEVVSAAGGGTRYQKTLILAGEVSEEMENMFRSGVGAVAQKLKQHLEAAAA
jgi:uncharacterized protein YndB with AHSA1/START domain